MKRHEANALGRAKYQRMWDVTAHVVRKWDPLGLLAGGAPTDEYDQEIASLVAQIPRIHSAVDAAHAVSRVFVSSFHPQTFSVEICSEAGKTLYVALSEQGLID
ncbi:MAG TPA: DUF1871 family protein [Steroidobacteraceae bacterium]|nr:DUF1871 family protein [Steroidobacteraceae bacterium]